MYFSAISSIKLPRDIVLERFSKYLVLFYGFKKRKLTFWETIIIIVIFFVIIIINIIVIVIVIVIIIVIVITIVIVIINGMSNDAPIHECESEIGHYAGHYVPYTLRRVCGFFNVPQI